MDFDLRGLLRRVAEEVGAEIRQVEKELAEARRVGARVEELSAVRDILYEDKWFRIATAVDQGGKVAAVRCRAALDVGVEAVFEGVAPGYRLEKTAQASKRAGVGESAGGGEAAEKVATGAEAAGGAVRRDEEGDGVERVLEEVWRVFSGLPVYVGVEGGYVYVKRTAPMDKRQFKKYTETCRRLGFRFDRRGERWVKPLEELKTA
jgi:hypothetical protein